MSDFDYIFKQGSAGDGDTELNNPVDCCVNPDKNEILIADDGNNRIILWSLAGFAYITKTSTIATGQTYSTPSGICYHDGQYFIADAGRHIVARVNASDLSHIQSYGTYGSSGSGNTDLDSPSGVCTDGQYLYIADTGNDRILKVTIENMDYIAKTVPTLSSPVGLSYSTFQKALYVVDQGNDRVIKLNRSLKVVEDSIGSNGTGDGEFDTPTYCAIHGDWLYVVDSANDRIQIFDTATLTFKTEHGSTGTSNTTFTTPYGIDAYENILFITEQGNDRLKAIYDYDPFRAITPDSTAKAGEDGVILLDSDTLTVDATDESGDPNRWTEERAQRDSIAWVEEDDVSSTWTEET